MGVCTLLLFRVLWVCEFYYYLQHYIHTDWICCFLTLEGDVGMVSQLRRHLPSNVQIQNTMVTNCLIFPCPSFLPFLMINIRQFLSMIYRQSSWLCSVFTNVMTIWYLCSTMQWKWDIMEILRKCTPSCQSVLTAWNPHRVGVKGGRSQTFWRAEVYWVLNPSGKRRGCRYYFVVIYTQIHKSTHNIQICS